MNEIAVLEQSLMPLAPNFAQVLPANIPPERLIRTVIMSVERLPKLLQCNRQSLFNAAMSAAVLGLEVDGVTGQAFLIPFKGRAQLVIGYKGYNTMGARAGLTIDGAVVREGDEVWDFELGDRGFVRHKPKLNNQGRIIAAWATASSLSRPPIIAVLGIDDIMAIKAKSPGAAMSDSPWNEPTIGFPAMASKSAKRRLGRAMPLNVMQYAARMEEAFEEQGKVAWISPERGVVIEGERTGNASDTPTAKELIGTSQEGDAAGQTPAPAPEGGPPGAGVPPPTPPSWDDYVDRWGVILEEATDAKQLHTAWTEQRGLRNLILWPEDNTFANLKTRVENKINSLKQGATS